MTRFKRYKRNLCIVEQNGKEYVKSYSTLVAKIDRDNRILFVLGYWSSTTQKHINYAAQQLALDKFQPL